MSYDAAIALARVNPNAYIEFVSGYTQGELHVDFQDALTSKKDVYAELPRNHGKTDQVIYRLSWEIGHDPNILIKVIKANDKEASDFASAVKEILSKPIYKRIFPAITPDKSDWNDMSFTVKRELISKDSTLTASGIFGNPGGRADIIVADDICTLKNSVQNAAQREQVKSAYYETWVNMLKNERSRLWNICTPWHVSDITADWRKSPTMFVFRRPVIGVERSPWPETWTPARLQEMFLRIGPIAYTRAYNLKPLTGQEIVFNEEVLLKYCYNANQLPPGRTVMAIDLAFTEKNRPEKTKKSEPDYSVIMLSRISADNVAYPYKCWRGQVTFPDFIKVFKRYADMYDVSEVTGDGNGILKGVNQMLADARPNLTYKFRERNLDKYNRAIEQQPHAYGGRFRFPVDDAGEVIQEFKIVLEEMSSFPVGVNDDTVDCAVDTMSLLKRVEADMLTLPNRPTDSYLTADIMEAAERYEQMLDQSLRDPDYDIVAEIIGEING